jgi:cytochrome c-type biogenesis protein CcmF
MLATLGFGFLVITFILALYGVGAAVYAIVRRDKAWAESARLAMLAVFPILSVSILSLLALLVMGDMQVEYVYNVISHSMPVYLKLTALWGGQAGSLLFWSWLVSLFAFLAGLRRTSDLDTQDDTFKAWVVVIILSTLAFFLSLSILVENPFNRYWITAAADIIISVFQPGGTLPAVPPDGMGLNPLLRHPGMIIHPPMLYLGFVSFIIPYAFAMAALITGRGGDNRWMHQTRRWALLAWIFLSVGLVLGMRWAYDVLGWGGYWGWDAVEVSSLLPWLTSTAFLHSLTVQDRRGLFKQWNMSLLILTYALVMWSTFLTRSGVLSSVHAFSESAVGPLFLGFIGVSFMASLGVLFWRWKDLASDSQISLMNSLFSREALFMLNNILFMGLGIVCFWGINYPILSELVTGQKITVGPPYYERAAGPLFGAVLLLMGLAPLSAWGHSSLRKLRQNSWLPLLISLAVVLGAWRLGVTQWTALLGFWLVTFSGTLTLSEYTTSVATRSRTTGESWLLAFWHLPGRNRRRYGGYAVHLGIVMMAIGVIGIQTLQTNTQSFLQQNQSVALDGYTLTYRGLQVNDTPNVINQGCATLEISRDGQLLDTLYPCRNYYYEAQQQVTSPGLRSTLSDDLYVVLVDWEKISTDGATFKVFRNPLVAWLWLGAIVLVLGGLTAALPETRKE